LSKTIFKFRGLVWGIFIAALAVFPVSFSGARTASAVLLLIAGQSLRFWAAGFIPKYRTLAVDAPYLVTSGPYAWIRNPLYAGNGVIGLGWALAAGPLWSAAFAVLYFVLYCLIIIPFEEQFLARRFGGEYESYKQSVNSLIPGFDNLGEKIRRSRGGFDRRKSWRMERHSLHMNILVTAAIAIRLYYSRL
jgi:protein-S-isoprenylcysteine O-methyltransferase Ste14